MDHPQSISITWLENLLEMQSLRPHPELLTQNLPFNKIPRGFQSTSKFEKCCFGTSKTEYFLYLYRIFLTPIPYGINPHLSNLDAS